MNVYLVIQGNESDDFDCVDVFLTKDRAIKEAKQVMLDFEGDLWPESNVDWCIAKWTHDSYGSYVCVIEKQLHED